jgi:hypothetical protein
MKNLFFISLRIDKRLSKYIHELLFVLLTWLDFRPVSLFYSVIFIFYVQISKNVTNNFCSPPHIKISKFVVWHGGFWKEKKGKDILTSL